MKIDSHRLKTPFVAEGVARIREPLLTFPKQPLLTFPKQLLLMRLLTFPKQLLLTLSMVGLVAGALVSCQPAPTPPTAPLSIEFEEYELENGLSVVLHVDRSDPVVAVAMTYHVGSSREKPDKTGFAHLFEHLLFLDSENLGPGGLDVLINNVGGTLNGFTDRDRTTYYEVVPSDALEKVLWAESDRLGFFINTVTPEVLEKEKQIVKNEKRQSVDNRPYGHTNFVIDSHIYPASHPYSWQVIGSLEDLDRSTMEDVHEFYRTWYVPNNATLVVSGDFDRSQTREWIEKYFSEIRRSPLPTERNLPDVDLAETRLLFHEDNFARAPALTLAWPSVEQYHPDSYALELLTELLSDGKNAPFNTVIVEEEQLAPAVQIFNVASELGGRFTISIAGFEGVELDGVYRAVGTAFERFEREGFAEAALNRLKAGYETDFYDGYRGVSSVLGKAFKLSEYRVLTGSAGYLEEDMSRLLAVTRDDVLRVYERYIKDRPFVGTSFVPQGQVDRVVTGSVPAGVKEEAIVFGGEPDFGSAAAREVVKTPSSFDRSSEPPFGPPPSVRLPEIWTESLPSGMNVYGIEDSELPVVRMTIRLRGGLMLDHASKVGVANLMASLMNEGTMGKTPEELEEAILSLGSSIDIFAGRESLTVSVSALSRNYAPTMDLVQEMLLEPRWDEEEFLLAKQRTISTLQRQQARPDSIAENVFNLLLYGRDHILSNDSLGAISSVASIGIDDLKDYYERNVSPTVASIHVVGDVSRDDVVRSLAHLTQEWPAREVVFPAYPLPSEPEQAQFFLVDVPGATQSVIRIGSLALAEVDPDFYPVTVMNLRLGGAFVSELVQILREQRGYTYGISSGFSGSDLAGPFSVRTSVRTNVTAESVRIIKELLETYGSGFDQNDLEATQSYLLRTNARSLEGLNAKVRMLEKIGSLELPFDYVLAREETVREMTVERIKDLAGSHINTERMIFLVVGDARTQLAPLSQLGLGTPILIDRNARPVQGVFRQASTP